MTRLRSIHVGRFVTAAQRAHGVSIRIGYAILGFATVLTSSAIFACCYLIVPFSRPMAIVITVVPALCTKAVAPHVLPRLPWLLRPLLLAVPWAMSNTVAITTPNVPIALRVLTAVLASAAAALSEVSCLGYLQHFGGLGLAGWGMGTGAGASIWAITPIVMTEHMGMILRDCLPYLPYLIGAMTLSYYVFLRRLPSPKPLADPTMEIDSDGAERATALFVPEPAPPQPTTFVGRISRNISLAGRLVRPFVPLLLYSFTLQLLVMPGMGRAYTRSQAFGSFESFYAAYSLVFHVGSFISRSTILYHRIQKLRNVTYVLTVATALAVINGAVGAFSSLVVVFPLVFAVGLAGGAIHANVFATVIEQTSDEDASDAEYVLGVIGVGETAGVLLGSLLGSFWELSLCDVDRATGLRWCYSLPEDV